jgi:hypothetical protein
MSSTQSSRPKTDRTPLGETGVGPDTAASCECELDQAQIDSAPVQLSYTRLTSPIDGVTGIYKLDVGNRARANGKILGRPKFSDGGRDKLVAALDTGDSWHAVSAKTRIP